MKSNGPSRDVYVLTLQWEVDAWQLELVGRARILADRLGKSVCCIGPGPADETAAGKLAACGADDVCFVDGPLPEHYCAGTSAFYVEAFAQILTNERPGKIFCPERPAEADLARRLAARLGFGLIAGCLDPVVSADGSVGFEKAAFQGRIACTFTRRPATPDMITFVPGGDEKPPEHAKRSARIRLLKAQLDSVHPALETLGVSRAAPDQISLQEADVIVAGGRGMGSAENFQLLDKLARLLGGTVAGSLGAVDEGWVPRRKLVGQTGTTVKPKLYIACGISGSIYHLMGMQNSRAVVAINRDRYAPIFKCADVGIVADAMEILPLVIDRLEKNAEA